MTARTQHTSNQLNLKTVQHHIKQLRKEVLVSTKVNNQSTYFSFNTEKLNETHNSTMDSGVTNRIRHASLSSIAMHTAQNRTNPDSIVPMWYQCISISSSFIFCQWYARIQRQHSRKHHYSAFWISMYMRQGYELCILCILRTLCTTL